MCLPFIFHQRPDALSFRLNTFYIQDVFVFIFSICIFKKKSKNAKTEQSFPLDLGTVIV